jgi:malonyl CoA-acyl carrier protein transacylase
MGPILSTLASSGNKAFLQFGGQGSPWIKELSKLSAEPELSSLFEITYKVIDENMKRVGSMDQYDKGFDLKSWLANPESAPDEDYLCRACISVPAIFVTQVSNYHLLTKKGYSVEDLMKHSAGITGHSQGVVAAALIGLGKDGEDFLKAYHQFFTFIFYMGARGQETYPHFKVSEELNQKSIALGDKGLSPMVAVIGYSKSELEERVHAINSEKGYSDSEKLYISLYNTPDSMIVSSVPSSLIEFRTKYKAEMDEKKFKFVYLKTTAPFHCPFMNPSWELFQKDLEVVKLDYKGSDFKIPVFGIFDGKPLNDVTDLREKLYKMVLIEPLHWDKAIHSVLSDSKITTILDFGPSMVSQRLTGGHLKASNIEKESYCASTPKELKVLLGA